MFFTFDGMDGVGKSTQMGLFCDWLAERGERVVTCRDPGSTPLGETLREVLLHSGPDRPIGPMAEMLLYMASRAQLVEEVIRPALADGAVVVSDRFLLANVVYQAHAGGLDREAVLSVGVTAVGEIRPDHTFVLDLDPTLADQRREGEPDRMESRSNAYRERLRAGFLAEAERDPEAITLFDAAGSIDAIQQNIRDAASRFFSTE